MIVLCPAAQSMLALTSAAEIGHNISYDQNLIDSSSLTGKTAEPETLRMSARTEYVGSALANCWTKKGGKNSSSAHSFIYFSLVR